MKNSFIAVVSGLQEKLKSSAVAAHNKAVQTKLPADISAANALVSDMEASTDSSIASWAAAVKNQTGIVQETVAFKDKGLEDAVRTALKKPKGDLYKTDVQKITKLIAPGKSIFDLSCIENLTNLQQLDLCEDSVKKTSNYISDITPLKGLTKFTNLNLYNNQIRDSEAVALKRALPNCKFYRQ